MNRHWNVARRQAQGERFLRMAGAADVNAARNLWKDPRTSVQRRCLAARAIGLLGEHGPSWLAEGVNDNESPVGRARWHGTSDASRRREAERRFREREEATEKMRHLGAGSLPDVLGVLRDRSENSKKRVDAAAILGGLKCREAVGPLIEALAEGHRDLSWMCMSALTTIGSRRFARRLIHIAQGSYPLPARQEAIYTLWRLHEHRAEPLSFDCRPLWIPRRNTRGTWQPRPWEIPGGGRDRRKRLRSGCSIRPFRCVFPPSVRFAR
jgi:hypothetical protein